METVMRRIAAGAALAVLATGCGHSSDERGNASTGTTRATTGTTPNASTGTTLTAKPGATIRFKASDGVPLEGEFTSGRSRRAPAVILIHEYHGGPEQWSELVPVLQRAGYAVLNYASRSPQEIDETVLARDVVGAVEAMRRRDDVDPRRIGLVGASIGGSAAVWAIGVYRNVPVRTAVGLTAVEGPALIDVATKDRFHPHDLLLIADKKEFSQAQNIRDDANGRGVKTWMSPFNGHGVRMLPSPEVRRTVLAWLRAHLGG
jgi:pimeloyl-ACP methyl ester carboxylesterase